MRNKLTTILLILAFFAGLSLLLYPTVSDYWNPLHASQAVADYAENVRNLEAEKYEQVLQDARNYNQMIPYKHTTFALSEEDKGAYDTLLDISGTGVMGYIEIPTINISLPVYHGTEDAVLQIAVGHLEWSSLPVGGEDTHCVLSGHRGLPSAKLFTNLDKLVVGDKFVMRVLDEVLTYEVDQILIVEPTDVSTLIIEVGKDLCTLVTCTPYGINSHRLLVRGRRIENQEEAQAIRVTSDTYSPDKPPDDTVTRTVLKVWDDKGYESRRPKSVKVTLLQNGTAYDAQVLSESNGWQYTWDKLPKYDKNGIEINWTIREDAVSGYVSSTRQNGFTFVLANSLDKQKLPQTGVLWWPVPILAVAGLAFLIAGTLSRKKKRT